MPSAPSGEDAFIYLAPSLERESQAQVDFTVAHEFAHALLRHHLPGNDSLSKEELKAAYLNWNSEKAADKLALEWGFTLPAYRKTKSRGASIRSSYERGCQVKKILPAPPRDAGVVTYIQPHLIPHLILRGVIGLVALARRIFPRRCQPRLLVPT
jgi:hypothetical protein